MAGQISIRKPCKMNLRPVQAQRVHRRARFRFPNRAGLIGRLARETLFTGSQEQHCDLGSSRGRGCEKAAATQGLVVGVRGYRQYGFVKEVTLDS